MLSYKPFGEAEGGKLPKMVSRRSDAAIAPASHTSPDIVTKKMAIPRVMAGFRLHAAPHIGDTGVPRRPWCARLLHSGSCVDFAPSNQTFFLGEAIAASLRSREA